MWADTKCIQKSKRKNEGGSQQVFKRKLMLTRELFKKVEINTYVSI